MISLTSITHTSRKPKPPAAIQNLCTSLQRPFPLPLPFSSHEGEYRSAREDHPQSRDRINDNGKEWKSLFERLEIDRMETATKY